MTVSSFLLPFEVIFGGVFAVRPPCLLFDRSFRILGRPQTCGGAVQGGVVYHLSKLSLVSSDWLASCRLDDRAAPLTLSAVHLQSELPHRRQYLSVTIPMLPLFDSKPRANQGCARRIVEFWYSCSTRVATTTQEKGLSTLPSLRNWTQSSAAKHAGGRPDAMGSC